MKRTLSLIMVMMMAVIEYSFASQIRTNVCDI